MKRTVHVVFVPDEEVGDHGMVGFVKSDEFKVLNVCFMLDEGGLIVNDDGAMNVYYGERTLMQTEFKFFGTSGHGSRLFPDTAGVKLNYVLGKMTEFREQEARKLNELRYPYGNVTTINLTKVKGGIGSNINVIPAEMSATFDIRVSVNADLDEFRELVHLFLQSFVRFCVVWSDCFIFYKNFIADIFHKKIQHEAGGNITIIHHGDGIKEKMTVVNDTNPFWVAFKNATDQVYVFN